MFPSHRFMETHPQSFPYYGNYMPYPHNHYSGQEASPPQSFTGVHRPASSFGAWPYHSNMSNQNNECSGCCMHSQPPMYYSFRPPYPHMQQPPHIYYHGPHPYHDAYPPYSPHYPFDQIRPDSSMAKSHCCGCPHHPWNKMDNQGLKIEEQNPEVEVKSSESSTLIRSPEYHPPVVWVPANFFNDREANKNSQERPSLSDGWIPMDINNLKSLVQPADRKEEVLADKNKNQISWPFIWMPGSGGNNSVVKDLKKINGSSQIAEEARPPVKIIPLKLLENENRVNKPGTVEDHLKNRGDKQGTVEDHPRPSGDLETISGNESKMKTIPVKQGEERSVENLSIGDKQRVKECKKKSSIYEKETDDGKKTSDIKQSSQKKSPKLPPICLRVDPLPRRKGTNGPSRPHSPLGHKDTESAYQDETLKKSSLKESQDGTTRKEIKVIDSNENSEAIEVKKQNIGENICKKPESVVGKQQTDASMATESMDKTLEEEQKGEIEEVKADHGESKINEGKANKEGAQGSFGSAKKTERRILSAVEAAVLIQAAYRGFEVRKWQPLEKLRKIQNISNQLEDVRKQIQDLEAVSGNPDKKQMMVIGEIIMSLLLQLDTIQGLHQSVREARKAVTKELINLQEKLDELKAKRDHGTVEGDGSNITALPDTDVNGINSSAVEADKIQESKELTHDESKVEEKSVDKLQGEVEKEREVEEEISEASKIVSDTFDISGEAISKDGEYHSNEEHVSKVVKSLDMQAGREEPSSNTKELETSAAYTVDEAVRKHSVPTDDDQSSRTRYETPLETGESEKLSALGSTDICKEISVPDGKVSKLDFIDPASQGSTYPIESFKDEFVESNISNDMKLEVEELDRVVPSVVGETVEGATAAEEPEFSSKVAGLAEVPSQQMEPASEISASEVEADRMVSVTAAALDDAVKDEIAGESGLSYGLAGLSSEQIASDINAPENAVVNDAVKDGRDEEPERSSNMAGLIEPPSEHTQPVSYISTSALEEAAIVNGDYVEDESYGGTLMSGTVDLPAMKDGENLAHDDGNARATKALPPPGPSEEEKKLLEENKKLRETLERLLEVGKSHLGQISDLSGRIKDLEKKLAQKKAARAKRYKVRRSSARKIAQTP